MQYSTTTYREADQNKPQGKGKYQMQNKQNKLR